MDSLENITQQIWQDLKAAPTDFSSPWRLPLLSTVDQAGHPQTRILVLRGAVPQSHTLTFFSDARAAKCALIKNNPHVAVTFFEGDKGVQLVLAGTATIIQTGKTVDALWHDISLKGRTLYGTDKAPGTQISPDENVLQIPTDLNDTETWRKNFAIIEVTVTSGDWLCLAQRGSDQPNRRAYLSFEDKKSFWRVP
jgi:general stress protein 26